MRRSHGPRCWRIRGVGHSARERCALGRGLAEQESIIFGIGFGTITDIITGPGGMYVLSLEGNLYRISEDPMSGIMFAQLAEFDGPVTVPEPAATILMLTPILLLCRRRDRSASELRTLGSKAS